jgi:hypothetical protein
MTSFSVVGITTCLSNLAVLASVIFLVRQMRQSTRHQQATMRHGRVQQLQMIYLQASQSDFVDVLTRGLAGDATMEARDCNRFVWFASTMFNMFENMFDQHRDGIVTAETFASAIASMRSQLAMPGARAAWKLMRGRYAGRYVDYVDRLMTTTPMDGVADLAVSWRNLLAEPPGAEN